jgi:hypothetical protein
VSAIPRKENTLIFFVFPSEKTFTVINAGERRAENKERERAWVNTTVYITLLEKKNSTIMEYGEGVWNPVRKSENCNILKACFRVCT